MNTFEFYYTIYGEEHESILITVSGDEEEATKMFWKGITLNHWRDSVNITKIDFLYSR